VLTCICQVSPGSKANHCILCSKDFGTRKLYTDHFRTKHAPFYVSYSGRFRHFSLPHHRQLTLMLGSTHLLTRGESSSSFRCHTCFVPCGTKPAAVKSHYETEHGLTVSVSSKGPDPTSSRQISSPLALSPVLSPPPEDADMEDGDFTLPMDVSYSMPPPFTMEVGGNLEAPGFDEDEWDAGSTFSDASTDILIEDDENDAVPPSFTLPTTVPPRSNDDEESLEPPPQPKEEQSSCFTKVYGSESMHSVPSSRDALLI